MYNIKSSMYIYYMDYIYQFKHSFNQKDHKQEFLIFVFQHNCLQLVVIYIYQKCLITLIAPQIPRQQHLQYRQLMLDISLISTRQSQSVQKMSTQAIRSIFQNLSVGLSQVGQSLTRISQSLTEISHSIMEIGNAILLMKSKVTQGILLLIDSPPSSIQNQQSAPASHQSILNPESNLGINHGIQQFHSSSFSSNQSIAQQIHQEDNNEKVNEEEHLRLRVNQLLQQSRILSENFFNPKSEVSRLVTQSKDLLQKTLLTFQERFQILRLYAQLQIKEFQ